MGFPQGSNTSARSPAPGRGSTSLGGPRTGAGAPITWLVTLLPCCRGQVPAAGTSDVPPQSPTVPGWHRMPYWDAELGCCNGFHSRMLHWDAIPGCCTGCHTGMPYWDVQLLPSLCSAQKQVAEGRGHSSSSCPSLKDRAGRLSQLLFPLLLAQLLVRDLWHNKGTADTEAQGTFGDQGAGEVLLPLQALCTSVHCPAPDLGILSLQKHQAALLQGARVEFRQPEVETGKNGEKKGISPCPTTKITIFLLLLPWGSCWALLLTFGAGRKPARRTSEGFNKAMLAGEGSVFLLIFPRGGQEKTQRVFVQEGDVSPPKKAFCL